MDRAHDTMMNPPIEELLGRVDSNQLGEGLGHMVPPQVSSVARKPLSIGFEEIAADKIKWVELPDEVEVVEDGEAVAVDDTVES